MPPPFEPGSCRSKARPPPKMSQRTRHKTQDARGKLQAALHTLRASVKYVGYLTRRAISAALTWASENPKTMVVMGALIIGGTIIIAVPNVAGAVTMVFGFSAVGPLVTAALAAGVQSVFVKILRRHGSFRAKSAANVDARFADFIQALSFAVVAIGATFVGYMFGDPDDGW